MQNNKNFYSPFHYLLNTTLDTWFIILTVGSATVETLGQGTGIVVAEGGLPNPPIRFMKNKCGSSFTSSNNEENAIICKAFLPSREAAAIRTDSLSLLKAIQSDSADTSALKCMFDKRAGKTILLSIQDQNGIARTEKVNAWAKQSIAITSVVPWPASLFTAEE